MQSYQRVPCGQQELEAVCKLSGEGMMNIKIIQGDSLETLKTLESDSVHCCVTSPPYWGLRDYGHDNQIGLEATPNNYVENMVKIFREVRRILRNDGTLWLNLGDSYASFRDGKATPDTSRGENNGTLVPKGHAKNRMASTFCGTNIKHKDLVGIPWRVAFALQSDGWYLRQDIIWHKPNPMPESVTDRCTKSHEYIFLLSKQSKYYYDAEAIKVPIKDASAARLIQNVINQKGSSRVPGKTNGTMKAVCKNSANKNCQGLTARNGKDWNPLYAGGGSKVDGHSGYFDRDGNPLCGVMANKKSVWTVTTKPYKDAHFATYPPELIAPCILAGCPVGGTVLDPFGGSGTTGAVALENGRNAILCELNPEYIKLINKRIAGVQPLLLMENNQ